MKTTRIRIYSPLLLVHLKAKLSKMEIPFLYTHDEIILDNKTDFKKTIKIIKNLTNKITKGRRK